MAFKNVIKTARKYGIEAKKRDKILDTWLRRGFGLSLLQFYTDVRGMEGFPVQTANLIHSVGVPGPITSSRFPIASLPVSAESIGPLSGAGVGSGGGKHIRKKGAGYVLAVHVGMVYARHVLKDGDSPFIQEPLGRLGPKIKENFDDSVNRAVDELAGRLTG